MTCATKVGNYVTDISIHALRKESDSKSHTNRVYHKISIHALRKESDSCEPRTCRKACCISIHALRKESDPCLVRIILINSVNFNPRSP